MTDVALLSIMVFFSLSHRSTSKKTSSKKVGFPSSKSHKQFIPSPQIHLFTYPKQIEFFRKIILKGDFEQSIEFIATLQSHLGQRAYKKACLTIYKQKLYQLINLPDQKQLKTLFENQIVNTCSEEQFQHLFALLTCRKTQEIPTLVDWTPIKGRLKVFQELLSIIQSIIYQHNKSNYRTPNQPQINLDQAVAIYLEVVNSKLSENVPNNSSKLIYNQNTSALNKRSLGPSQMQNSMQNSLLDKKQIQLDLSQSAYEKSMMIRANFDRKSRLYMNNQSSMQQNESQKLIKSTQKSGLKQSDLHGHKHEYSGSKLYQEEQIKQISEEQQRSDTIGSNTLIQRSRRSAELSGRSAQLSSKPQQRIRQSVSKKYMEIQQNNSRRPPLSYEEENIPNESSRQNIQYLQQTNSVVYNNEQEREHQNFTFSHHNFTGEVEKPKKTVKLAAISDNKAIRTCQFSSSGSFFAVGTNSSILKIFDVQTLFKQNKFNQISPMYEIFGLHSKSIFCLDWGKDQTSMVTCSNDLTIKLTQFSQSFESHEISVIGRHQSCIRMVKFNQEQSKIFSCGDDSLIKVWDMGKVKRCYNLKGHNGGISAFKVCENSNELYSVSKDSTIKRWDLRTLQCIATSNHQESEMTYIADNTERIVASNRNGNVLYFDQELNLEYEVKIHDEEIRSIEACRNQDSFITASFDGHVGMFSQKSIHSPDYFQHNENSEDKVVFATFLDHPEYKGFASTSTLGLCHIYSYF